MSALVNDTPIQKSDGIAKLDIRADGEVDDLVPIMPVLLRVASVCSDEEVCKHTARSLTDHLMNCSTEFLEVCCCHFTTFTRAI